MTHLVEGTLNHPQLFAETVNEDVGESSKKPAQTVKTVKRHIVHGKDLILDIAKQPKVTLWLKKWIQKLRRAGVNEGKAFVARENQRGPGTTKSLRKLEMSKKKQLHPEDQTFGQFAKNRKGSYKQLKEAYYRMYPHKRPQ